MPRYAAVLPGKHAHGEDAAGNGWERRLGLNILTVNSGSSSLRLAAFRNSAGGQLDPVAAAHEEQADGPPAEFLGRFVEQHALTNISVVAHRVVHGGAHLVASRRVDKDVEREIERLEPLAPLHNARALRWIRACRDHFGPRVPQVAVFDTAFFSQLPQVARGYALPRALTEAYQLRRYGFHGLAHRAMWRRWDEMHSARSGRGRIISLQLGSGCSVAAIRDGVALDISMGFSPLEGLVMATRCGDVDAGMLTFLQRSEALTPDQTDRILERQSGLLGVSGISGDMRVLLASNLPDARQAVDLFCYRARKYVGAYLTVLGGADGVLFSGGVGEHASPVRERILHGMEWCGIAIDPAENVQACGDRKISADGSGVEVWVLRADESGELAREALGVMGQA